MRVTNNDISRLEERQINLFGSVKYKINARNGSYAIDMPCEDGHGEENYKCGLTKGNAYFIVKARIGLIINLTKQW